jgi:hypothetical protein
VGVKIGFSPEAKKHRLRVTEQDVENIWTNREKLRAGWRKTHNLKFHSLYSVLLGQQLIVVVEWLTPLVHIWEVPGSNLDPSHRLC